MPVPALRDLVTRGPTLGDLILRAFLLPPRAADRARRRLPDHRLAVLARTPGGCASSPPATGCRTAWIDLEEDPAAEALLRAAGRQPGGDAGGDLARRPGAAQPEQRRAGPASSACRRRLRPRPLRPGRRRRRARPGWPPPSTAPRRDWRRSCSTRSRTGGQAGTSARIENYLGFPAGISGAELAERAVIQAEKFGAHISVPGRGDRRCEQQDGHHAVTARRRHGRSRRAPS